MANSKVKTVIVNRTNQELVLRVGNGNCFAKLAPIVVGGEHQIEIDINWTYQEFSLEPAKMTGVLKKIVVSSDDCCDFERMTVTESGGKLHVDKAARGEIKATDLHCPVEFKSWRSFFTWPPSRPKFMNWRSWL